MSQRTPVSGYTTGVDLPSRNRGVSGWKVRNERVKGGGCPMKGVEDGGQEVPVEFPTNVTFREGPRWDTLKLSGGGETRRPQE